MHHGYNERRYFAGWLKSIASAEEVTDTDLLHLMATVTASWNELFHSGEVRDALVQTLIKVGAQGEHPWLVAAFIAILKEKLRNPLLLARIAQYGCQRPVSDELFDFCATHGHWKLAQKIASHGVSHDRRKMLEERLAQRKEKDESIPGLVAAGHWHKLVDSFKARGFAPGEKHHLLIVLAEQDEARALIKLVRAGMGLCDEEMRLINEFGGEKVREFVDALAATSPV